jgi:hypothetical protein
MNHRALTAATATAVCLLSPAAPASAAPATVTVSWLRPTDCSDLVITSTKDISNLVYVVNGERFKIEFSDGTTEYVLPGEVTEVWVKSGNNGHRGLGQYFPAADNCPGGGSGGGD